MFSLGSDTSLFVQWTPPSKIIVSATFLATPVTHPTIETLQRQKIHLNGKKKMTLRYRESNPGLLGSIRLLRASDVSHYTIPDTERKTLRGPGSACRQADLM